jgi:hypothetical protein
MKLSFLFGAGAEISYGLPSGGKFALDIFRQDTSEIKSDFKKERANIDSTTTYAGKWLPQDYSDKSISSFGKPVFETIIKDTINHNRERIIKRLNDFDEIAEYEYGKLERNKELLEYIEKNIGGSISNCNMSNSISFIEYLKDGNAIFSSNWFSAFLKIYTKKEHLKEITRYELQKMLMAILQLQLGALSADFVKRFNDGVFKKKDDKIDFLDDIGEIFRLNYKSVGLTGLEYIMENRTINITDEESLLIVLVRRIVENIYSTVLDYKTLIDSNWHYLYCPKEEWAKFCKISIFLHTVKKYIEKQICDNYKPNNQGYYNDVLNAKSKIDIISIATTNYNTLIDDITDMTVHHLNGATNIYYDPYLNRIGDKEVLNSKEKHFLVPLIFTQSGTKPMTSIDMSLKYVNVYNSYKESDYIVIIGFGFNSDDEHINGIIRTLVDVDNKKIIVIDIDKTVTPKKIAEKLKITKYDNINIIVVDENRNSNDELWIDTIINNKVQD